MRIVVPDLVANSYFPALAAEELGYYAIEDLDAHVELLTPAPRAIAALRDGRVDTVAAGAHTPFTAFPQWHGAKLVVVLAQGTPWLLVLRADIPAQRGDLQAVKGLDLGAAPGPDAALRRLQADVGVDPARDGVRIGPVPGADAPDASFGVLAAQALEAGQRDGFCANALGSETAVCCDVGKILVDVRCGDGPPAARSYRFSALVTTETLIARAPEQVAAAVRVIALVQRALQAAGVGRRRFPPDAAAMIATLVERDLPFYDPSIPEPAVTALNGFAQGLGLLTTVVPYEQVVATRFCSLWHGEP